MFKQGDQIQAYDSNQPGSVRDGIFVRELKPKRAKPLLAGTNHLDYDAWYKLTPQEREECEVFATINWEDDDSESDVMLYGVYTRDTEYEREFRLARAAAEKRINEKLKVAMDALNEAEEISNETGIPFSSSISPLSQGYTPPGVEDKFPNVSREFINDLSDVSNEYDSGWQHSAVCY